MQSKAPTPKSGASQQDVPKDLSPEQLQGIGAVAISWNEVEFGLACILYSGLILDGLSWVNVIARLSLGAKIELIDSAQETLTVPDHIRALVKTTVNTTNELKGLRNSVVHARVFDAPNAIGENIRPNGSIGQVLLTPTALHCLYQRLVLLREELHCINALFDLIRTGDIAAGAGVIPHDQVRDGPEVHEWTRKLQESQSSQLRLKNEMPKF